MSLHKLLMVGRDLQPRLMPACLWWMRTVVLVFTTWFVTKFFMFAHGFLTHKGLFKEPW